MITEQPKTITITLPCPLEKPQNGMWFIDELRVEKSSYTDDNQDAINEDLLEAGCYFATKEDAQAWIDALKNNRR